FRRGRLRNPRSRRATRDVHREHRHPGHSGARAPHRHMGGARQRCRRPVLRVYRSASHLQGYAMTAIAVVAPMATRRKKRLPIGIMLCFGFVLVVILAAFVGPHFLTRTANTPDPFNLGATPTARHWLGTDEL